MIFLNYIIMETNSYAWVSTNDYGYIISRSKLEWWQRINCSKEDIQDFLSIPNGHIKSIQLKIQEILFENQLELDLWKNPDIK